MFPNIIPANLFLILVFTCIHHSTIIHLSVTQDVYNHLTIHFIFTASSRSEKIHGKTWFWKNLCFIHHRPWRGSTVNPSHESFPQVRLRVAAANGGGAQERSLKWRKPYHFSDFLLDSWAVTKTLVIGCIEGIMLPSYIGIVIRHYEDPY